MCTAGRYCWRQITGFYLGLYILSLLFGVCCISARRFNGFSSECGLQIKRPKDGPFAVTESWENLVYCFLCAAERRVGAGPVVTRYLSRSYDTAAIGAAVNNAVSAPAPRRCSPRPASHAAPRLGDCQITWQPSQTSSLNNITNRTTKKK